MFEYRITKYDQSQRNESGAYIGPSAWTCYSDVGETFDGEVLTIEECLRVESAYIGAAIKLFEESGLPYLRLTRVEEQEWQKEEMRTEGCPLYDPAFETIEFTEDTIVFPKDMRTVLHHTTGLYVERNYPSPYKAFNLPTNILHIVRSKLGEEFVDDSFEINLPADYLERLKPIWGFSDEHPFLGNWRVDRNCKEHIGKVVGKDFNFEAYEYYIQTVGWRD